MTHRRMRHNRKKGGFIAYFVFCLFAIIWLRSTVFNLEYEIGKLSRLRADLVNEQKMVIAQRASYYSTENIEGVAIKKLGMKLPERKNVFYVQRETVAVPYRASVE
jgi:cell division protein FtsL